MIIERIMTRDVQKAFSDMNVREASSLFRGNGPDCVPVVDRSGRFLGVIKATDIHQASPDAAVVSCMVSDCPSIRRNATVEEAADLMASYRLSVLPVLDGEYLEAVVTRNRMFGILLQLFGASHFGTRIEFLVEDRMGTISAISRALADRGMFIVSFATFPGTDSSNAICTVKVSGASSTEVLEIIRPLVLKVLDIREV